MLRLPFEALEVSVRLPLAPPVVAGLKTTLNEALCPAFRVTGRDSPLTLNPLPVTNPEEIVTLSPPLLVTEPLNDFEVPA